MEVRFPDFLNGPAPAVAPKLLGCYLVREIDGETIKAKIVETEAYDQTDAASHSYRGQTPRTDVMFGPSGFLYVYFTYGMHYCCNVVTGERGEGSAVLIRGIEPVNGKHILIRRRNNKNGIELTNGPAKLCQALGIDKRMLGHDLRKSPLRLEVGEALASHEIVQTLRVGIKQAVDVPWRFYIKNNPYVSKPWSKG